MLPFLRKEPNLLQKIVIANRGEIAARIIRTCHKLGIETVAVYSEADAEAPYVQMASEAYFIGGARVAESYLNADKIIEIAKSTGAAAIHPGYGFLSENAAFARKIEEEGIVFIGPPPDILALMGSKIDSRKVMEKAGVPIVPGILHPLADADEAAEAAKGLGYPVMLKASAGGGGIGMQIVRTESELRNAFVSNKRRAADFFGDGAMYMEKLVEHPRHIEIQLLADAYGNIIHLWERECSIQRRHQKIVEEAPSPFLDDELRQRMGETAVRAAKAIGYRNAGTIEFLVDRDKNFYFLEMNTRLQVEHPVTEEITGLDLVAEQIGIASGRPLELGQDEVKRDGNAIEVRIYAEDPKTFYPSPGKITRFSPPEGELIRHELGVREGSTVTPYYDPMIAKLVVKGRTREEAVRRMEEALANYTVEGIKSNIPMLLTVIRHPEYRRGNTTTSFVAKYVSFD